MNYNDLELRLRANLRANGKQVGAAGIDLGTTKCSLALAHYDPELDRLSCECVTFPQADGSARVAVPSAVALIDGEPVFGVEALRQRGARGIHVERDLFYDTKNLMGLRYTYARAPEGFRTPQDIAASLLRHLRMAAVERIPYRVGYPGVVTVPASFHGAQRQATLHAAEDAFDVPARNGSMRLLDEPYAAFIDLKFRAPEQAEALLREGANVLVFDFGGGTCDVAVFRVDSVRGGTLGARLLGTSRYHRLGGGDIDRAIVHDVLIPQLLRENGLERWSVSWRDKRRVLEPCLLDVAERLKLTLSLRMADQIAAGNDVLDTLETSHVAVDVEWNGRQLRLLCPSLSVAALDQLMRPFLDPDPPPESGDEYVQRSSMFAPIVQALFRARLESDDVHGILLCGSSSLLPQVREALAKQFPDAQRVMLGDAETLQGAVARGAALQALSLQVLGEPLVAPVCSADLSLRVVSGSVALLNAGDAVPNRSKTPTLLRPARDNADMQTEIAVEVMTDGQRMVGRTLWNLPPPVSTADRLALDWRIDDNQCVELRLSRLDHGDAEPFVHRFDAPITHRDPGQLVRCRMLEREEAIRNEEIRGRDLGPAFERHARDCGALGEYEKALHFVTLAMQETGQNAGLLNLRGIYREKIGDRDGARDSYHQAGENSITQFNLALLHKRHDEHDAALAAIDRSIDLDPTRAAHSLRGDILDRLGKVSEARLEWQDAVAGSPDWDELGDFELGWMERAAACLKDDALARRIREERKRLANTTVLMPMQGELPERAERVDAA
ncbi:MAG TPA: Hsp70 family protein [Rhodanobacteraceae bacterium]|nr:Hsp70 family protein [Rhodanobacteraceae bacterium]